ncbi:MAG: peptidase M22 [Clostridia bacterium]|nr:peptidase M22 [Clostridia bacterium]
MKRELFLGIDTSNYTTSVSVAAVSDCTVTVIANLKAPLPVKTGERGLRQSDAVFAHVKNLPGLMDEVKEILRNDNVTAVGYSATPRDVEGSYMPCFLVGEVAASTAAAVAQAPLYSFSHQAGHIRAAVYSSGMRVNVGESFIAFHVSGGTTEVVRVTTSEGGYETELLGGTRDISCGQAIDRIGVMLGMPFPAGRYMEIAANEYSGDRPDRGKISVSGLDCNLSGVENMAAKLQREGKSAGYISAFTLDFVGRTLVRLSDGARDVLPDGKILYSGGVMSNGRIKEMLKGDRCYFATPEFSADNAAGVALLTAEKYLSNR